MAKRRIKSMFFTIALIGLGLLLSVSTSGCSNSQNPDDGLFTQEITRDVETTVGTFETTKWQLQVPKDAFDEDVNLSMKLLSENEIGALTHSEMEIIGSPVEITAGDNLHTYLSQPVTMGLKLPDDTRISTDTLDDFVAAYYNGNTWYYIFPDIAKINAGYIYFDTYHFSLFTAAKLSESERIKLYTQKMATQTWETEEHENAFSDTVMDTFNDAFTQMGITDQSAKGKLLRSVAKEYDFGALLVATERGEITDFSVKCGEMAANALIKHLQTEASLMENITGKGAAVASGLVKGALQMKDGNYTDAAKELSNAFIGYFPAGKAYQATIELINASIGSWKDYELDEAYKNYVSSAGSDSTLTDDDWATMSTTQLRGYLIRLQQEAKDRYCKVNGISRTTLDNDKELSARIVSQTEMNLRKTFEKRLRSETEIKAKQDDYQKIIEGFKRDLLLDRNAFGFDIDMPIETRLRSLFAARNIILDHFDGEMPVLNPGESAEANLNEAIARWLSYGPQNRAEFYKWLEEKGYVKKVAPTEKAYRWVLIETRTNETEWRAKLDEINKNENWQVTISASQTSAVFQNTYVGPDQSKTVAYHLFPGNSATGEASWSPPNSSIYNPGDEITLNLSVKNTARADKYPLSDSWLILAQLFSINEKGEQDGSAESLSNSEGVSNFTTGPGNNWESFDETVSATMGASSTPKSRMAIRVSASNGSISAQTYYVFEWQEVQ